MSLVSSRASSVVVDLDELRALSKEDILKELVRYKVCIISTLELIITCVCSDRGTENGREVLKTGKHGGRERRTVETLQSEEGSVHVRR